MRGGVEDLFAWIVGVKETRATVRVYVMDQEVREGLSVCKLAYLLWAQNC